MMFGKTNTKKAPTQANGLNQSRSQNQIQGRIQARSQNTEAASFTYSEPSKTAQERELKESRLALIHREVMATIEPAVALQLSADDLEARIHEAVDTIATKHQMAMGIRDLQEITHSLIDEMLGLGPLQPLVNDPEISDIMVNGPKQIFIEKQGKVFPSHITFRDEDHLVSVARRIVSKVGRRIDEATPMVDARLSDGSRVNVIMPPLALDGTCISIRKFVDNKQSLQQLAAAGSMSMEMAEVLDIAARCKVNILVSGGTGAGKTTLLNAMSFSIAADERIITIEDAAELKLQQPHVIRLETRPESIEGTAHVDQRQLLKNALRMRPDRILLGEVRGIEAYDMMQAMNTGHDGSMSTLHANSPGDALIRLENMLMNAQANLPLLALRRQIASTVELVVQVERMADGKRRVVRITELTGLEGDQYISQDLFSYQYQEQDHLGNLHGHFVSTQQLPKFVKKARYYQLDRQLKSALGVMG